MELLEQAQALYKDYPEIPYISPKRDLEKWLVEAKLSKSKLVVKRQMNRLKNGLLAGDIILLWRIQFGTFTNETPYHKYFEYMYGIDAKESLKHLIAEDYVYQEIARQALERLTIPFLKMTLKEKNVANVNKMKKEELIVKILENFSESELEKLFTLRGYQLTEKGQQTLLEYPEIIDKHPKKKF